MNDKIGLMAPNAPDRIVIAENLDNLGELTQVDIGKAGTYYSFGVYPQDSYWTVINKNKYDNITFDEDVRWSDAHPESTLADGEKYILGSDNCWYEKFVRYWYNESSGESGTSISYYKVQPIIWQVFKELPDNKIMLVPINALRNAEFYPLPNYDESDYNDYEEYRKTTLRCIDDNEIYPNNYKYSKIRAFINSYDGRNYSVDDFSSSGFFKKAFTDVNRDKIFEVEVDNSIDTTTTWTRTEWVEVLNEDGKGNYYIENTIEENQYICENTFDKVFLLSYKDLEDNFVRIYATDYARENGCSAWWIKDTETYLASYYTRSPCPGGENQVFMAGVNSIWDDEKEEYTSINYEWWYNWSANTWAGLLPAIVIQKP